MYIYSISSSVSNKWWLKRNPCKSDSFRLHSFVHTFKMYNYAVFWARSKHKGLAKAKWPNAFQCAWLLTN